MFGGVVPAIPLTQSHMEDFKGNHWLCRCRTLAERREEEEKALETCLDEGVQAGFLFLLDKVQKENLYLTVLTKKFPQKYIFVSGGVLSGLGKGITTASIGLLLKSRGIKVTLVKCDMYLNIDAGTMNPLEHGEVFVTADGMETDQDLGHYERFLGEELSRENYITAGQIYGEVLKNERALKYDGKCVEAYQHLPPEIIRRVDQAAQKHRAKIVLVELGGTAGEYQNVMFFEAIRRLKLERPNDVILVHVGYLPMPPSIGELKSKPLQQSVHELNSLGLQPDFIVARSEKAVDRKRREKIALASGLSEENIFANPDVDLIYEVPLVLEGQSLTKKILKRLDVRAGGKDLEEWRSLVKKIKKVGRGGGKIKIGVVGKYQTTGDYLLSDSYVCVVEAIKHASWANQVNPEIVWVDSERIEKKGTGGLEGVGGIIVPQGWGRRGVEGKIKAVQFARENKVPFLGLCFGMQMAVIEFARNVCGLKRANSTEVNPRTPHPVIHIMPRQAKYLKKRQYGGTIRLGQWPCKMKEETVHERHRHRYEVNNRYKRRLEAKGLVVLGTSPDGKLVEAIGLPPSLHPFFVGTQFHPEYQSWPLKPHPLFLAFIQAVKN